MDKSEIVTALTSKIKLVRVEANYSQDRMADVLGISKKTLVQIEKEERRRVGQLWSHYAPYFVIARFYKQI